MASIDALGSTPTQEVIIHPTTAKKIAKCASIVLEMHLLNVLTNLFALTSQCEISWGFPHQVLCALAFRPAAGTMAVWHEFTTHRRSDRVVEFRPEVVWAGLRFADQLTCIIRQTADSLLKILSKHIRPGRSRGG